MIVQRSNRSAAKGGMICGSALVSYGTWGLNPLGLNAMHCTLL